MPRSCVRRRARCSPAWTGAEAPSQENAAHVLAGLSTLVVVHSDVCACVKFSYGRRTPMNRCLVGLAIAVLAGTLTASPGGDKKPAKKPDPADPTAVFQALQDLDHT